MNKPSRIAGDAASRLCAAGTLRRATRTVTRLYDKRLARVGLTTTQYSILHALEPRAEPVALSRLAEEQVFERTSLYRALEPLRRDGLVKLAGDEGRRAKEVSLTARGRRLAARALPHWQEAQAEFLAYVGRPEWARLSAQLASIVDLAR
jgi:DNA-binding MarR family transcriptional regulator